MKRHDVRIPNGIVLMWEDGEIIFEGEKPNKIETLLYIIQEYQKAFGGFKVKADTSEWMGWEGKNPL